MKRDPCASVLALRVRQEKWGGTKKDPHASVPELLALNRVPTSCAVMMLAARTRGAGGQHGKQRQDRVGPPQRDPNGQRKRPLRRWYAWKPIGPCSRPLSHPLPLPLSHPLPLPLSHPLTRPQPLTRPCSETLAAEDETPQDGEKLALPVKELGSCEVYPQLLQHNPNGRYASTGRPQPTRTTMPLMRADQRPPPHPTPIERHPTLLPTPHRRLLCASITVSSGLWSSVATASTSSTPLWHGATRCLDRLWSLSGARMPTSACRPSQPRPRGRCP